MRIIVVLIPTCFEHIGWLNIFLIKDTNFSSQILIANKNVEKVRWKTLDSYFTAILN